MFKKQNTIENQKNKRKRDIWIVGILLAIFLFSISYNTNTQTKSEEAIRCLDNCEFEYSLDICSSMTSYGDSYSDILEDNEELQYCIEDFASCVDDCKKNLDED